MSIIKKLVAVILCMFVFACSDNGPEVGIYKDSNIKMDFQNFFDGKMSSYGMIQDWRGKVVATFTVDTNITWEDNKAEMIENFIFDDGQKMERVWFITKHENGEYAATANDVVGEAVGVEEGIALNFVYKIVVPRVNGSIKLNADDKTFMITTDTLLNKTTLSKFGVTLARITMFIKKS